MLIIAINGASIIQIYYYMFIDVSLGNSIGFDSANNITSDPNWVWTNFTDNVRDCFGKNYHGGIDSCGHGCEI